MALITIGGKERPISFGRNAMIEFERLTGQKLLSGNRNFFDSSESWSALMYAGLKWGLYNKAKGIEPKPDFTMPMVNDWIEERIESLSDMWAIFNDSFPKAEKKSVEYQNDQSE